MSAHHVLDLVFCIFLQALSMLPYLLGTLRCPSL